MPLGVVRFPQRGRRPTRCSRPRDHISPTIPTEKLTGLREDDASHAWDEAATPFTAVGDIGMGESRG